jgi:hypothetical protein
MACNRDSFTLLFTYCVKLHQEAELYLHAFFTSAAWRLVRFTAHMELNGIQIRVDA